MRPESGDFQEYSGTVFANEAEVKCARLLDYHGIRWEYEPHSFPLETDDEGRVVEAFTPDFYLPEQELYLEVTVMKQSLVTRKNRKIRKFRERYPDIKVKLFYTTRLRAAGAEIRPEPRYVEPRPGEVYLSRGELAARVEELGAEIARDYAGSRPRARHRRSRAHSCSRRTWPGP